MARQKSFAFIIVVAIVSCLMIVSFFRPLRSGLLWMLSPFANGVSRVGGAMERVLRIDRDAKSANERVDELESRLRAQTIDYVRLRALEEENMSLRAQANFITERHFQTVGARIISRSIGFQTAVVTINRGSADGIESGQAVTAEDGVLIGKIESVDERISTVLLLSDMRSRVASSISGDDRTAGVLEGKGSDVVRLSLIPQAMPLERDRVIVTAGTDERIPANLPIGLVNDVESQPTDPFKEASVELLVSSDRLELVSVVIP